jgi:hypothetical protein
MQVIQFPWDGERLEIGPLAATVAQMPPCGVIAIGGTHIGIPAPFLRAFLDAYRHLEQYARVRFILAGAQMGVTFQGLRNYAFLKSNLDGAEGGIVRLDLVAPSEYRVLLPPTKQELALVKWVCGVVQKPKGYKSLAYQHTMLVQNGWMAANNGYQMRIARAPRTQGWAEGVYFIEIKGESIYLNSADVEWSDGTQAVINDALAGHQFRLTVEAIRAAMWQQEHVWIQVQDGPGFFTKCKPVLAAVKTLKPTDVVVFRAKEQPVDDTIAFALGGVDRLQVMMMHKVLSFPASADPVEFPGSDQRVSIYGTLEADVQKRTIITPISMPAESPLLIPDLTAA